MIVETLLNFVTGLLQSILSFINLPSIPGDVDLVLDTIISYINEGITVLANYIDTSYVFVLFALFVQGWLAINLWRFVIWAINKVPIVDVDCASPCPQAF